MPFPLLQAIAELPEEGLHSGLTHLQAAEFLYETRLFPEREYIFKHALTHEVAYGSLLQERRRALHGRIVEAIERLYPDRLAEQVEGLAHHALRGEVWDKALLYSRQAGAKAVAHSAYREAVACFEQALVALRHLPESRAAGSKPSISGSTCAGRWHDWESTDGLSTYLSEAETLAEAWTIEAGWRKSPAIWLIISGLWADYDRALVAGQRALALAAALGDVALQAMTHEHLGTIYYAPGRLSSGDRVLQANRGVPRRGAAP